MRKHSVGSDGGSGLKFPRWKSVAFSRGSSASEKHGGRTGAEQPELAHLPDQQPFPTCVLLHHDPAPRRPGITWHMGSHMRKRSSPLPWRRHNAQQISTETAREASPIYDRFQREVCSVLQYLEWAGTLAQLPLDVSCWWFGLLPSSVYLTEASQHCAF